MNQEPQVVPPSTRNDNFLVGFHEERTEEPWDHPVVAYWKKQQ